MSYLNTPFTHRKISVHNRLVMPPMATAKAEADGSISRDLLEYYEEKSHGGYPSLIIIEHSFVSRQGKAHDRQLSIAEDRLVDGLKGLADTIHRNGSKAVMQINHAGSAAHQVVTGMTSVGPSAVLNPAHAGSMPTALEIDDIAAIVDDFCAAAHRVQRAGFDGVEIHSAHGYLLNQFLSPLTNKRTDVYGGDLTGRMRLHIDIITAIRATVGDAFPILLRLGAADYMEGGLTIDDSIIAAQAFETAGVDLLDISGGLCLFTVPNTDQPGYFAPLSKAIKAVVSIPILVTGGITRAEEAEQLLRNGKADLIGVGRAIYQDSNWASNAIKNLADAE